MPFYGVLTATVPSLSRFARLGRARVVPLLPRLTASGYEVKVLPAWTDFPLKVATSCGVNDRHWGLVAASPLASPLKTAAVFLASSGRLAEGAPHAERHKNTAKRHSRLCITAPSVETIMCLYCDVRNRSEAVVCFKLGGNAGLGKTSFKCDRVRKNILWPDTILKRGSTTWLRSLND